MDEQTQNPTPPAVTQTLPVTAPPPAPLPPPAPVPAQKNPTRIVLLVVLAILLAGGLAVAGILISRNQTKENIGSLSEFIGIPGEVTFIPPGGMATESAGFRTQIAITVMTNEKIRYELNSQEQYGEWLTKPISTGEGERLYKSGNTALGNIKAVQLVSRTLPGDPTESFYSVVTWFRKNGANYYIELGGEESKVLENIVTYNQILESFSFL
ncbi:MAG: hypothetical protein UX86_C0022G0007 [Candidatus Amesbacteria bacterium GW2011_GWC1_47_15]|uniref:Uncharacterized protein n=1 Tax=Candidatus Amesbacteria bacterium GW2011_GWC1_47_15 TaxID=1618364 RepID=A0A0G1UBN2_9BACT|nr:MAG: hypothetical protein UX86_C0022G0007 [Candidatus Amesbacteria bacterium GW2011_GWC1_47_15]